MAKKDYTNWDRKDLIKEIEQLRKRKKYGLVWEDKPENVVEQCKTELPVLEEVQSKEIITDPDKPTNILIEGDNYHALSVLNYTHKGKIDVIYIDPPYNTGAKDWKYNNDYVDINDRWIHSKWLSMMNNRLKIAKNVLKKNGVLICAIDENEISHLGVLLEELFPSKYITPVTVIHNPSGIQGKNFSNNNEFLFFVYNGSEKSIALEERDEDSADVRPFINGAKGNTKSYLRESGNNSFYPILVKNNKVVGFGDVCAINFHPKSRVVQNGKILEIYPIDNDGVERKWLFSRNSVEEIIDELSVKINSRTKEPQIIRTKNKINYKTVWISPKYNAKKYGTELVKNILNKDFPFPKSLYAVEEAIKASVHPKDSIILDFFAGSGTTGHAVLNLNSKDEGRRKFILCTNNEGNIAEEICYPRIKKVIAGYADIQKAKIEGLGGNLKYFKTSFVPAEPTDKNKIALTEKATEMLCIKEDTFEEVKSTKQYKIYRNKKRYTGIVFDHQAIDDFKKEIAKIDGKFSLYIFSLGDDTFDEEFEDMKKKVKLSPIPEAILRVYRRVFK